MIHTRAIAPERRQMPTLLGGPMSEAGGTWSAPLWIPGEHPFFFDHPLDHVPGVLTVFGLLDLLYLVTADHRTGQRLLTQLTFPKMCDLGRPVLLSVTPDSGFPGGYFLRSVQDDATTCEGWLQFVDAIAPSAPSVAADIADGQSGICPSALVHRARTENVLLGPLPEPSEIVIPLRRPPAGHYLDGFAQDGYSARSAIEAGRQFTTLLIHKAAGKPLDTKHIWLGFSADLPLAPAAGMPVALRWRTEQLKGSRVDLSFDLLNASSAVTGSLRYQMMAVSEAAYCRFWSR